MIFKNSASLIEPLDLFLRALKISSFLGILPISEVENDLVTIFPEKV